MIFTNARTTLKVLLVTAKEIRLERRGVLLGPVSTLGLKIEFVGHRYLRYFGPKIK